MSSFSKSFTIDPIEDYPIKYIPIEFGSGFFFKFVLVKYFTPRSSRVYKLTIVDIILVVT